MTCEMIFLNMVRGKGHRLSHEYNVGIWRRLKNSNNMHTYLIGWGWVYYFSCCNKGEWKVIEYLGLIFSLLLELSEEENLPFDKMLSKPSSQRSDWATEMFKIIINFGVMTKYKAKFVHKDEAVKTSWILEKTTIPLLLDTQLAFGMVCWIKELISVCLLGETGRRTKIL